MAGNSSDRTGAVAESGKVRVSEPGYPDLSSSERGFTDIDVVAVSAVASQ